MSWHEPVRCIYKHLKPNKRDELSSCIHTTEADVVVLTETWLSTRISNCELFNCEKVFAVYTADGKLRVGGGRLIAVSESLSSAVVHVPTALEMLWVSAGSHPNKIIVSMCYRPPSSDNNFLDNLHDTLNIIMM